MEDLSLIMPPKLGKSRRRPQKRKADCAETACTTRVDASPESGSQESPQHSPSPPPSTTQADLSGDEGESASLALPPLEPTSQPRLVKGNGNKGKSIAQIEKTSVHNFTEQQEEEIARWMESKRLLYDMKDKQYKDKALRRQLWEGKAAEYGVDYNSIQKWYHTQRTRFSKLREGQPRKQSQKRSGAGLSSDEGEDPIIDVEASEHDSDRDRFIRRIFNFLRPHIKRQKKDTPASFKDKLSLAETGELAGSDDSTIAGSLTDETKEPTKKYTGYPTPRPSSRSRKEAENRPGSPSMQMKVTGASLELQDRLVQFITREQQVSRATPFCKYLETELDRLHEACLDPAYEEITTVLNHYRKMSKQFRMREADGERISPLEDVPSAFQSKQQRPVTVAPVSASAIHPRVSQLQQESSLSSGASYSVSRAVSSPSDFQPSPRYWPLNPPPASVWRSQECGYVEQANQQYNLEQQLHSNVPISASTHGYLHSPRRPVFTQLHSQHPQQPIGDTWQLNSMQPVQNPRLPLVSSHQSQYNVSKDGSANIDKDDPSALETNDDNNNTSQ